jgi:dihydrodipicolinate synthase/N-acetylneuraminate lyase
LPVIAAGGDGVISVIANTLPVPFTKMVRKALKAREYKKWCHTFPPD